MSSKSIKNYPLSVKMKKERKKNNIDYTVQYRHMVNLVYKEYNCEISFKKRKKTFVNISKAVVESLKI